MSEHSHVDPQPETDPKNMVAEPESKVTDSPDATADQESTIGTGTSMALGCIAGTILLIGIALLFLLVSRFF